MRLMHSSANYQTIYKIVHRQRRHAPPTVDHEGIYWAVGKYKICAVCGRPCFRSCSYCFWEDMPDNYN